MEWGRLLEVVIWILAAFVTLGAGIGLMWVAGNAVVRWFGM